MSRSRSQSVTLAALAALTVVMLTRAMSVPPRKRRDRGDVPGWVLITVMTAGLVSTLWVFAGNALLDLFKSAISSVSGSRPRRGDVVTVGMPRRSRRAGTVGARCHPGT